MDVITYHNGTLIGFTRQGSIAEFSADASDLFGRQGAPDRFQLHIAKSGNTRTFYARKVERDNEGDVTRYVYETRDAGQYMTFAVFND